LEPAEELKNPLYLAKLFLKQTISYTAKGNEERAGRSGIRDID